jgi:hypothetical protein
MFDIDCDNCGESLIIDLKETADAYSENVRCILDSKGDIVENSIPQYLIYSCALCKKTYKFTYQDWEKRLREKIFREVMEIRKQKMFREEINPLLIKADNGLSYCGQCSGYDGSGYCLNDIIKRCTIRKKDGV